MTSKQYKKKKRPRSKSIREEPLRYLHVLKLCKCRRHISFNHFARRSGRRFAVYHWNPLYGYNGIGIRKMPSLLVFFCIWSIKTTLFATKTKTHVKLSVCCVSYSTALARIHYHFRWCFLFCERICFCSARCSNSNSLEVNNAQKKWRFYEVCVCFLCCLLMTMRRWCVCIFFVFVKYCGIKVINSYHCFSGIFFGCVDIRKWLCGLSVITEHLTGVISGRLNESNRLIVTNGILNDRLTFFKKCIHSRPEIGIIRLG